MGTMVYSLLWATQDLYVVYTVLKKEYTVIPIV